MAKIVYQNVSGRIWIDGKDYSLEDVTMTYTLLLQSVYEITFNPQNAIPVKALLSELTDNAGGTYANITAWCDWWESLDFGTTGGSLTDGTQKTQVVNSAGVSSDAIYRTFELTITRPANQTPYTLGDCIGNASEALPKFVAVAKAAGMGVNISNVRAKTTDTALAGKAIKVHFFKNTIAPVADNAAFAIPDVTKYADYAEITFGASGSLSAFATSKTENIILNPVGVDIPVQVESPAFTPSANSTTITLEIGVILTA